HADQDRTRLQFRNRKFLDRQWRIRRRKNCRFGAPHGLGEVHRAARCPRGGPPEYTSSEASLPSRMVQIARLRIRRGTSPGTPVIASTSTMTTSSPEIQ